MLTAPDRRTIANMVPEYGAMSAFFPVDEETLDRLRRTGRTEAEAAQVRDYWSRRRLMRSGAEPAFGRTTNFDLGEVGPGLAGPGRPDQRISLGELPTSFAALHAGEVRTEAGVSDGDVVIAAITSCTSLEVRVVRSPRPVPGPVGDLRHVGAVDADPVVVADQGVLHPLA
ncbi:aconitase family protein [Streptomyces sp. SCSIO 30461]|uniref:aconitase family protein n=1 Tax=Streptomyces sp. SCSIO 30461 TaxID=3118085 RepID=UPI0030D5974A